MKGRILFKKYPNRRLYDTVKNTYVKLEDIAGTLAEGHDVQILDAKTDKDLTKSVLRQILIEKEKKPGRPALMSEQFLKDLIRLYDSPIEGFVPIYLDQALNNFIKQQKDLTDTMAQSFGDMIPPKASLDIIRAKEKELEQALQMFKPFSGVFNPSSDTSEN
jgi:polyhydroxyalkanoate synthesis repressor PhaR